MPTYAYACKECDARTEVFQRMTDEPLTTCEACGGSLRRVLFPVGIVYKGSGFYTTDYARRNNGGPASGAEANGSQPAPAAGEQNEKGEKGEKSEKSEKQDAAPAASGDSASPKS